MDRTCIILAFMISVMKQEGIKLVAISNVGTRRIFKSFLELQVCATLIIFGGAVNRNSIFSNVFITI
jgi:hypothetical protein